MELSGFKAVFPPLGIITVASLLPQDWEIRFLDRNVSHESEADWLWCDLVIVSAMLAQKQDFHFLIQKAVKLDKKIALGRPYLTSITQGAQGSGADNLVFVEGQLTIRLF